MLHPARIIITAFLLLLCPPISAATIPQDSSAAVILAYHRIDEDSFPATNLRFEQFESHINDIINNDYNIQPLNKIIQAIKAGEPLPRRTIAITFEGAYKSTLNKAIPLLKSHNLPFTVFYASDLASANTGQYMNWKDLEELSRYKNAEFGILPAAYIRLKNLKQEETLRLINNARIEYRKHFNAEPTLFSYPFGEWSKTLKTIIHTQKFTAALALHSGVAYPNADFDALPRFSITENYGDLERFQLITNALPLPITEIEPNDPVLKTNNALAIGFTIDSALSAEIDKLSCYISGHEKPTLERIGKNRIELRPTDIGSDERIRINCTLPESKNTWRWMGMLLTR